MENNSEYDIEGDTSDGQLANARGVDFSIMHLNLQMAG